MTESKGRKYRDTLPLIKASQVTEIPCPPKSSGSFKRPYVLVRTAGYKPSNLGMRSCDTTTVSNNHHKSVILNRPNKKTPRLPAWDPCGGDLGESQPVRSVTLSHKYIAAANWFSPNAYYTYLEDGPKKGPTSYTHSSALPPHKEIPRHLCLTLYTVIKVLADFAVYVTYDAIANLYVT